MPMRISLAVCCKFAFTEPGIRAIAGTAVSGDQRAFGIPVWNGTDFLPSGSDRPLRESSRVMVDPNIDSVGVAGDNSPRDSRDRTLSVAWKPTRIVRRLARSG